MEVILAILIIAFIAAAVVYGYTVERWKLTRRVYEHRFSKLYPVWEDKKILFFSDLHLGRGMPADKLEKIVSRLQAEKADLILIGGDLSEKAERLKEEDIKRWIDIIRPLHAPMGIYIVQGNHDAESEEAQELFWRICKECNFQVLLNQAVLIDGLVIAGLAESVYSCPPPDLEGAIEELSKKESIPEDTPQVILYHQPDPIRNFAPSPTERLFLSGHTHGGQIKPLGLMLYFEKQGWRLPRGHYQMKDPNTEVFVSAGLGTVGIHARYAAPPDYVILKLKKK